MRHKHSLTWNMSRNTEKVGKLKMHTIRRGSNMARKPKIMENEKHTL